MHPVFSCSSSSLCGGCKFPFVSFFKNFTKKVKIKVCYFVPFTLGWHVLENPIKRWKTSDDEGIFYSALGIKTQHNSTATLDWLLLISLRRDSVLPYLTNLSISFWEGNVIFPQIGLNEIFIELLQWKSTELGRLSKRKVSLQHSS